MTVVLGVSAMFHDAAVAVLVDGEVVAAAQEERFTRTKHDARLPTAALRWCLDQVEIGSDDIDAIAYYEKPLLAFDRAVRSIAAGGPRALLGAPRRLAPWFSSKLWVGFEIERAVRSCGRRVRSGQLVYAEHHESHAAAAYYPSPFPSAATLTFDGVGEWSTSSIGHGRGRRLDLMEEQRFPASIGLLYTAFTVSCGFRANSGEYKLMGLAPYGEPSHVDQILAEVVDLHDDGSFDVDLSWFDYVGGERMTSRRFHQAFGPDRSPDAPLTRRELDLAASVQQVIEEIVLRIAHHAHELTGERRAVLAGGVALNGVANARLAAEGPFDELWVPPAPGDAGSAMGAAYWAHHEVLGHPRAAPPTPSQPGGALGRGCLGPSIDQADAVRWLEDGGRPFERIEDPADRAARVAELLAAGAVVAVADGPLEFGPRALGNRSILADPRSATAAAALNRRVKRREGFRPFAPAVLVEHANAWFDLAQPSPFMSFVVPVLGATGEADDVDVVDLPGRLASVVSPLPAVTHVDGTARVQTVDAATGGWFHEVLSAFWELTGCPVLLNTSFNVRGEPIVATHQDAYRCFATTDIDWLVLGDVLLRKDEQPAWTGATAPLTED